ncbi:MAG: Na/Pi cotransporter family protein [Bacteroidales bacterium]|nr:Na/Pi cotransporter family protein [Bacteroidales bacterium]
MDIWHIIVIIINFAGALGIFLYGMKLMSGGLQKFAGRGMRHIMGKITNNPIRGILTGTIVTTAIQSSSATTVMVVSFVNAGMITLAGAIAVIMGANIGTTVTAWIITLLGLGESTGAFSFPLLILAISLPFMFAKKDKLKSIGEFIIGFSLLLLGMNFLQSAMPNLEEFPKFLEALSTISNYGFLSILLFIVIGAILTCLVQASAAMMAITLVMCYKGWIGLDVAVALVMGQNIGTTITANLAAIVANTAGKKAARAHFVFNVIGVILTLIIFHPIMNLIAKITEAIMGSNPYISVGAIGYNPTAIPLALALFHTFFNVVNTVILAWFIPQIIKIVDWMVKPVAEDAEDEFRLTYIGGSWMNTAELNIQSAKQEIEIFSNRVLKMYSFLPSLRYAKNEEEFGKVFDRIKKYEGITDRMEVEIAKFLTKISEGDLSEQGSQRISSMLRIIDNLESIGDAVYQIAALRKDKFEAAVHFDQHQNDNLEQMTQLVQQALDVMNANLQCSYSSIDLPAAYVAEEKINKYRDKLRAEHLEAIKHGKYNYAIGTAYSGLYALYEKLGDYVINVSEAIDDSEKVAKIEAEKTENLAEGIG